MIQLVIIGNGFDLAHGNETHYKDFFFSLIKCYFKKAQASRNFTFENAILTIKANNYGIDFNEISDLATLIKALSQIHVTIEFKGKFVKTIINDLTIKNWADIERLYYDHLNLAYGSSNREVQIRKLNTEFDLIKQEFIDYLSNINLKPPIASLINIIRRIVNLTSNSDELLFLNFNYTETLSKYNTIIKYDSYREIRIHGTIEDPKSIIFGYGDESETNYLELEKANQNFYLDHFKSFQYIQSTNYTDLFEILDNNDKWYIHIVGHSCGVSDRILLKELFDNDKCKKITIYPYRRENGTFDITEKVQQISRHFNGNSKHKMRRIITYDRNLHI